MTSRCVAVSHHAGVPPYSRMVTCATLTWSTSARLPQIVSLQALAEQLERNKALIQDRKQALAGKQRELDRLSSERHSAEKLEAEARHATRNKDRRIEENCRQ